WANILVELGSSNLNFSKEITAFLIGQIACHVGPGFGANPLRKVHQTFLEDAFCTELVDQISERLKTISSNWRENNAMELLVTLILRLVSLVPQSSSAIELLEQARLITLRWIRHLRQEIHSAKDADSSRTYSRYALWAALLCRRTYSHHPERKQPLDHNALQCFIE